ncbi:hypothetical protein OCS_00693 [Ophiocordyceps sinensis CO18]|uniref:Uncharacterized protein n=1 Tax=Ophiocordyceps sinensis (strain Co18 / CGMCC 3.14243) TaxID=911162 RepID=T5AP90_OPHSC|nr:hypothetical protein OCS_00693 [Ophiocordyceps sinensis CO18]
MSREVADAMDPLLTDEEIIEGFNPLERRFCQWVQSGANTIARLHGYEIWETALRHHFHKEDQDQLLTAWFVFARVWFGRHERRTMRVVERDELLEMIWSTPCMDSCKLARNLWIFNTGNLADLFLGESDFGGVLTGYSIEGYPNCLYPDISRQEMSNPNGPGLLNGAVLSMDRNHDLSRPAIQAQDPTTPRKRREQNRRSGEDLAPYIRSATGDDFEDKEPFCFFQIGSLLACTGQEWADVREQGQEEVNDAEWEATGYVVVVELRHGYPQGPVYLVYNFHEIQHEPGVPGPLPVEINWKDAMHHELPHIRRLYPNCNQKFFLAKIADKLDYLDTFVPFNFEVIEENRRPIIRAKLSETPRLIIPNDAIVEAPSDEGKRVRAEGM